MRALVVLLLSTVIAASSARAQHVRVLLLNVGPTDVQVEDASKQVHTGLQPGEGKEVQLLPLQWLKLGQEAYLYNTSAIKSAAKSTNPVIQVGPGVKLYLLPAGTTQPLANPPKQPTGFPLQPRRKVDLT